MIYSIILTLHSKTASTKQQIHYLFTTQEQLKIPKILVTMQLDPEFKECDIVKKYNKYPEFRKELDQIQKAYRDRLNMSLYSTLDRIQKLKVFQFHKYDQKHAFLYINFYGFRMPQSEEDSDKLALLWIKQFDQQLREHRKRKYIVIYHHAGSESNYGFAFLNNLYKVLPLQYYAMLEKIIVIDGSIMIKSVGLFDFGRLHKLFNRRIQFVDNLKKFMQLQYIKRDKVCQSLPETLIKAYNGKSDKTSPQKMLKQSHNQPLQLQKAKTPAKRDLFTVQLTQHKLNASGIPIVLQILIATMRNNPSYLRLEGIFRKAGCFDQQQQIMLTLQKMLSNIESIDKKEGLVGLDITGFSVAAIIKKFFTKLLTPVFPYEIYNKILQTHSISPDLEAVYVRDLISDLPAINRKTLLYITSFIKYEVITFQQQNKMNNYNMSVVFCPCFFRSKNPSLQDLMNSGRFAGVLNVLFNRFDQVVGNEEKGSLLSPQLKKRGSRNRGSKGSRSSKGQRGSGEPTPP